MRKHYEWRLGEPAPLLAPHSKAKHQILEAYLRRYIEICTFTPVQESLNLTIIDGFSGGGRYSFAGRDVPGSPLILLNTVAHMQEQLNLSRPRGFKLLVDFVFIDSRKEHAEYLRTEIANSPFANSLDRNVRIWDGSFEARLNEIIEIAHRRAPQTGRSLFLLDQYGWNAVAFAAVRRILQSLNKAEVFLTFAVDSLIDYMNDRTASVNQYAPIGLDAGQIRELLTIKDEQHGWRTIIQNSLYRHLQAATGAQFYSPFFIRSADAHRTYWLVHLSRHREARNEIGKIHWKFHNQSLHHGGAGLEALGFTGHVDTTQMVFGYQFDDTARAHSQKTLSDQIPRFINAARGADAAPTLEELFGARCNDTPVTRDLFENVLLELRDMGEIRIEDALGVGKPRAKSIDWSDRIILSQQRSFFGPFGVAGDAR